ncbi:MAG: hypothetical protein M1840_008523 [Geoglossum simile]|nr:MAG: hypothetical protein M1840_008523 [Geoglossum simile]
MTPSDNIPNPTELDTAELRHVLSNLTVSSTTPAKAHSDGSRLAFDQAKALITSLCSDGRILVERPSPDGVSEMINRYLGYFCDTNHEVVAPFLTKSAQFATFIASIGAKRPNELEFRELISYITANLEQEGTANNKYVHMGSRILHPRVGPPEAEKSDPDLELEPDFFSTKVVFDSSTGTYAPESLSTLLHPLDGSQNASGSASAPFVLTNIKKTFATEDVITLWEIKSGDQTSAGFHSAYSNLITKATEVLRFQWQRLFVNGFLICGTQLRMLRVDRSCVLISQPVDVKLTREGSPILVRCILADLVTQYSAKGFVEGSDIPTIVEVDGKPRQEVQIDGKKFILGDQIAWPLRGHLSSRATAVHLAREPGDREWNYCHKSSWPYESRLHEGVILRRLQDIKGVVDAMAWSSTDNINLAPAVILSKYHLYKPPKTRTVNPPRWAMTPTSQSSRQSSRQSPASHTNRSIGSAAQSPSTTELHMRQHRQIVTKYIPCSLADLVQPVDILKALRSLYYTILDVAAEGWNHRDLSWNNIRVLRDPVSKSLSVVLIDADLAVPVERMVAEAPDKTGTPAFMSIETLTYDISHYQELHEDESAFWTAFLTAIGVSDQGSKMLVETLFQPGITLRAVGTQKTSMLSGSARRNDWPQWICGRLGGDDRKWKVVRDVFMFIADLQFGPRAEYDYTTLYQDRESHLKQHGKVVEAAIMLLDKAIPELEQIDEREGLRPDET